jgi:hypothetical protein
MVSAQPRVVALEGFATIQTATLFNPSVHLGSALLVPLPEAEAIWVYSGGHPGCQNGNPDLEEAGMAYQLEGKLLEVCNCNVLCPCWIGENPDNGTCDTVVAYHIEKGTVDGTNVSGLTLALVAFIPENILKGNWRVAVFVDDKATPQQQEALLKVWTGKLGGPVADLAKLVGEVLTVQRAPITFTVTEGEGTLKIGDVVETVMAPYKGGTGQITTLNESVFSTIPGSPAYVSKASSYKRKTKQYGLNDVNLRNTNAIQGAFRFVA